MEGELCLGALWGVSLQLSLSKPQRCPVMLKYIACLQGIRTVAFERMWPTSNRDSFSLRRVLASSCSCWESWSDLTSIWALLRRVLLASSSSSANESFSLSWLASLRVSSRLCSSSEMMAGSGSYRQEDKGTILAKNTREMIEIKDENI